MRPTLAPRVAACDRPPIPQADASKQQAADAQARSSQLEAQMTDMNAKKTDRGMVVTVGDVLFDTNQQLKPGGMRNMDKVAGFLKQYPMRKALIEGFTDSSGSDSANQGAVWHHCSTGLAALVRDGQTGAPKFADAQTLARFRRILSLGICIL